MKSTALLALLSVLASAAVMAADDTPEDLLRFTNDDQLHGRFQGMENGTVVWQRKDVAKPIQVEVANIRQVVLHGGRPIKGIGAQSVAYLVGGDQVPGNIVSFDENTLVLETPYAGTLNIPRDHIDVLAPVPFGGSIRYAGPFSEDGWQIGTPDREDDETADDEKSAENNEKDAQKAGEDQAKEDPEAKAAEDDAKDTDAKEPQTEEPRSWIFARAAWYSAPITKDPNARAQIQRGRDKDDGGWSPKPLILRDIVGDAGLLRFHLSWRNQLGFYVAFQADFAPSPKPNPDAKQKVKSFSYATRALPYQFGNSYALALASHYGMLYGCGFEKDGEPFTRRLQSPSSSIRLGTGGEADIELRFDRNAGRILLFIDGQFCMQWDEDPKEWIAKGKGIGFLVTNRDCQVRISDILVADWNGRIDSARSMEDKERDVVLLTNGTDRFSGEVGEIKDGTVAVKGSYATMNVPLEQVAEIHFARNALAKEEKSAGHSVVVQLHPLGRLSGKVVKATAQAIEITSPHFGDATIQLDYANLLDFQSSTNFIDEWDIDF